MDLTTSQLFLPISLGRWALHPTGRHSQPYPSDGRIAARVVSAPLHVRHEDVVVLVLLGLGVFHEQNANLGVGAALAAGLEKRFGHRHDAANLGSPLSQETTYS